MSFIHFAHNGVDHNNDVEAAVHNWPSLIVLGLVAVALLGFAYWLLTYKPKAAPERKKEDK